jgi:hypothetical protein
VAPEPEGSSPHSQQPANGPYPEPPESTPLAAGAAWGGGGGGVGGGGVEWIHLAQDSDRWRALVNAVMNLRVLAPQS